MPTNKKIGGRSARARRRIKRAQLVNPRSGIYGAITPITITFYGRYELTEKTWSTNWGMSTVSFGNTQIFSGPYEKLKFYREFLIRRAHFNCTHEVIRTPKWKKDEHSEISTFSAATFIQDYSVEIKPTALVNQDWNYVCSHPGVKSVVIATGASKNTSHTWIPTEPSDIEWRLTNNDGLCYLYLMAFKLDQNEEGLFDTYGHSVSTVVRAKIHLHLRGLDIQNDDTVTRSKGLQHVVLLNNTPREVAHPSSFSEHQVESRSISPEMVRSYDTAESAITAFASLEQSQQTEKSLDESFTELAI